MVSADPPQLIREALKRLTDEKTIAGIKRDLDAKEELEPRPFFSPAGDR